MQISDAMHICFRKGIKIYPVFKDRKWYICKEDYGRKKFYPNNQNPKDVPQNYINEALEKTYISEATK